MSLGLYLHIPYCFSKCRYCDFYSHPGERGVPDAYVDALLRELARFAPDAPLRPDTVYFGGGTPSLLSPAQVGRLIRAACPVSGAEVTLEANPETVTEESLQGFREAVGLRAEELPLVKQYMINAVEEGRPVVCAMAPGDFTTTGHYIILTGYDENGFTVNDPNSPMRSSQHWSYETLEGQISNLWAFSKA